MASTLDVHSAPPHRKRAGRNPWQGFGIAPPPAIAQELSGACSTDAPTEVRGDKVLIVLLSFSFWLSFQLVLHAYTMRPFLQTSRRLRLPSSKVTFRGLGRRHLTNNGFFRVSEEVREALHSNKPVVALETTIYTHGTIIGR